MSYDLVVLHYTRDLDEPAIRAGLEAIASGSRSPFGAETPELSRFIDTVTAQFPQLTDLSEDQVDSAVWSIDFDARFGVIELCMVRDAIRTNKDLIPLIYNTAQSIGLAIYDPQDDRLLIPDSAWQRVHGDDEQGS